MSNDARNDLGRRSFLKAAAATGLTALPSGMANGSQANSKLQIGIIGSGGRGRFIGKFFEEHPDAKVVALHDYFRDRVEKLGEELGVEKSRQHIDFGGYKELLAGDVDAVVVTSPPYFHPEHVVDALKARKHVYIAKPVAADVPGCLAITKAAKKAGRKLSVLVDFQTRNNEFFRGAAKRVHEGMIGEPVLGQCFYQANRLQNRADPGGGAARLRNWVFDKALSGDIIVEQNVHVLDVANWYLQGHPVKAYGTGGRKARVDVGDCWDHFAVAYTYPNDVPVQFSSGQYLHGFKDLCIRLFGTLGTVDSHYGGLVKIRGKKDGWRGGETNTIYRDGARNNVNDFIAGILEGKPLNNAEDASNSALTGVLGRIAAYENREVTWKEMLKAKEKLEANLDLPANGPELSPGFA